MTAIDLMIVDDSPSDRAALRIAFERTGQQLQMHFAKDGEDAWQQLHVSADGQGPVRPHMMLVDMKMPGMSGLELLKRLKADHDLALIPVIILSDSDDRHDIAETYRHHACCYIRKARDLAGISDIASTIARLCHLIVVPG